MLTAQAPSPIPLAELLRFLETQGYRVDPDDYTRLRLLLAAGGSWNRARMAEGVASLLAGSRGELEFLRRALREYLGVTAESVDDLAAIAAIDTPRVLAELLDLGTPAKATTQAKPTTQVEPTTAPPNGAPEATGPDIFALAAARVARRRREHLTRYLGLATLMVLVGLSALFFLPGLEAKDDTGLVTVGQTIRLDVLANDRWPVAGEPQLEVDAALLGEVTIAADSLSSGSIQPSLNYQARQAGREKLRYTLVHLTGRRSATVELVVVPAPSPPPSTVPTAPQWRTYRDVLRIDKVEFSPTKAPEWPWPWIIASFLFLALALTIAIYYRQRDRDVAESPLPYDATRPARFSLRVIGGARAPWLSPATLDRLVVCLRYHTLEESSERLDLPRTVAATSRLLVPELIFEQRRETMAVLLVVDENTRDFAWHPLVDELERGLEARGATTQRALFGGRLEQLFVRSPHRLFLPDFEASSSRFLVLLVTDGRGFRRNDLACLRRLASWPHVIWLDPREPRFWDESVIAAERAGLEVRPFDEPNLVEIFLRLLGREATPPWTLASLRRQGVLVRRQPDLRADLRAVLGGAAPWAQACAMLQPMPLALAEHLRRRFFADQPAIALGRLLRLPGSTWTPNGLEFGESVLALLRQDFALYHLPETQEAILATLLAAVDRVEPAEPVAAPGLAHLAWQLHREKLRLEIAPDDALPKLRLLATTPLGDSLRAELGSRVLPGRGRPAHPQAAEDYARIPLRLAPQTPQSRSALFYFAPANQPTDSRNEPTRGRGLYFAAIGALALLGSSLGIWALVQILQLVEPVGWQVELVAPALATPDSWTRLSELSLRLVAVGEEGRRQNLFLGARPFETPLRDLRSGNDNGPLRIPLEGFSFTMAPRENLEIGTLSDGLETLVLTGSPPSSAGRVAIQVDFAEELFFPCTEAFDGYSLERCPRQGDSAGALSRVDHAQSIAIEFGTLDSRTADGLHEALLALPVVDRVYRIQTAAEIERVKAALEPWRQVTRTVWLERRDGSQGVPILGVRPTSQIIFGTGSSAGDQPQVELDPNDLSAASGALSPALYSLELPTAILDYLVPEERPAAAAADLLPDHVYLQGSINEARWLLEQDLSPSDRARLEKATTEAQRALDAATARTTGLDTLRKRLDTVKMQILKAMGANRTGS